MAVPSSGAISMDGLHKEKTIDNYSGFAGTPTHVSLYDLVNGGNTNGSGVSYDATNTAGNPSSNRPDGNPPHEMSEWYSYDHDATK